MSWWIARLDALADSANDNTERLARAVRQAFEEARASFGNVAAPEQLNEFVRQHVGEMVVEADGAIHQKGTAPGAPGARQRKLPELDSNQQPSG
jgi:hypothetical protein